MRSYRYCILLTCFAGLAVFQSLAQSPALMVERRGNQLRVAAPQLHFLEGKPLERLTNGASITYLLELTLAAGGSTEAKLQERFILSYDLWEEKFSAVQAGTSGHTASHLTAAAAEAWCLDSMPLPVPAFGPEKAFTVRLDVSYAETGVAGAESNPTLTLAGLIDVFSRKKREEPAHWEAFSKTIRLKDLKQNPASARSTPRAPRK